MKYDDSWKEVPCNLSTSTWLTSSGYAYLYYKGKSVGAHRLAWEQAYGPIPDGIQVCHKCVGAHNCIEPLHLFLGTQADNNQDNVDKGRARGRFSNVTHCIHGHELTSENVYTAPDGKRQCKKCRRNRDRKRDWA